MDFLAFILIGIAVAPLLLLGLYMLASHFNLKVADRMLDWTVVLLKFQWLSGSVLNLVGGLALGALGIWMSWHFGQTSHRLLGAFVAVFGLWRAFRGVILLRQLVMEKDPS